MRVAKIKPVMTLLAALSVFGAAAVAYRLWAGEPQGAKPGAPGAEAVAPAGDIARLQLELTYRELFQVQSELRKGRLELQFWTAREEKLAKLPIPNSEVEEFLNQDPAIAKYHVRLAELRDLIAQSERVTKDSKKTPEVKDYQNQIAATEKIIEALRKMLQPQIVAQRREKAVDILKGRLVQLKEQIELNEELEKALKAEVQRLSDGLRSRK